MSNQIDGSLTVVSSQKRAPRATTRSNFERIPLRIREKEMFRILAKIQVTKGPLTNVYQGVRTRETIKGTLHRLRAKKDFDDYQVARNYESERRLIDGFIREVEEVFQERLKTDVGYRTTCEQEQFQFDPEKARSDLWAMFNDSQGWANVDNSGPNAPLILQKDASRKMQPLAPDYYVGPPAKRQSLAEQQEQDNEMRMIGRLVSAAEEHTVTPVDERLGGLTDPQILREDDFSLGAVLGAHIPALVKELYFRISSFAVMLSDMQTRVPMGSFESHAEVLKTSERDRSDSELHTANILFDILAHLLHSRSSGGESVEGLRRSIIQAVAIVITTNKVMDLPPTQKDLDWVSAKVQLELAKLLV